MDSQSLPGCISRIRSRTTPKAGVGNGALTPVTATTEPRCRSARQLLHHSDLAQRLQIFHHEVSWNRTVFGGQRGIDLLCGPRAVREIERLVGVLLAGAPLAR